ncbi:MAG: hypothetical protein A3H02_00785 [Candidatus Niyogibacteria bacterium RIFCSPLOWO2_12_FULL_41_13]|uniref:Uncharacterized protein n=1 Tax=Candidatus Niyogibacteria bacterium RIFCSPLOWO2_12_FULL_41_13 TaxID=1801726 RepID=A0A1G2F2S1_9BACT|nr:MAG: hypothetical protein A3H02_00785 [Candidatus Niyogibacteria bacterium RIFCSPLOWO2_12_FULL_41_13]
MPASARGGQVISKFFRSQRPDFRGKKSRLRRACLTGRQGFGGQVGFLNTLSEIIFAFYIPLC